jgi:hypothetical protein
MSQASERGALSRKEALGEGCHWQPFLFEN